MEIIDKRKCEICNKLYSSYKSLWNHNNNIHKIEVCKGLSKFDKGLINYSCRFCNKNYNNKNSRWSHEQKCKIIFDESKLNQEKQNNEIKMAEIELEKFNLNKEKEIKLAEIELELAKINSNKEIELKKLEIKKENSLIKKEQNSHQTATIKKINKMLRQKISMTNSNNNNTTNIQNNNIVHNHFKIEPFGKENILNIISDKEKKLIINQGSGSIEKLIEITNAGKYDQFKNIVITNKRDNTAYIYDEKTNIFISCDKNWALNKLISNRLDNVEEIYNELDENNKLNDSTKKILSGFFIKFSDEDKIFIDENANNKEYKNYTDFKIDKVNNLLFNNQDKIIKDITTAIENSNNTKEEKESSK
jgi:hypothetical protein